MSVRHAYKVVLRLAIYAVLRPLIQLFRILPLRTATAAGGAIGSFAILLLPWFGRKAVANLAKAFPHLSDSERFRIATANFRHLGRVMGEYLSLTGRDPALLKTLVRFNGMELLERAISRGKGVIVLTAHLGSWEIAGAFFGLHVKTFGVVARDLYDRRLNALLDRFRGRYNIRTYDIADTRGIIRHLKNGGTLGVLVDQNSRRVGNVTVPFFGLPAPTPVGPVRLARRTGATLLMGFSIRAEGGYRMVMEELVSADDAEESVLGQFNRRLEGMVREHPSQWVWLHDRWATRADSPSAGATA